jgi:hypothetical protein
MGSSRSHRRAGTATILAGFLLGAAFGLTACSAGGENPSTGPSGRSSERSTDRPSSAEPDAARSREPDRTTAPAEATRPPRSTAAAPKPSRTTAAAETTTRPPTTAAVTPPKPSRTTAPAETTTRPPTSAAVALPEPAQTTRTATAVQTTATPAASASAAAAAAVSQGMGPFGWLVLIALLAAMIIGGLLVYRSQRRSAWDTEARALESETRTVTTTRLPPVLSTTTISRRGLAWPPVRAALGDVVSRWNSLTERASGEDRRNWSLRISGLLQELMAAVDAENEALAAGRDWMLQRPAVSRAEEALAAALTVQPQPEPPTAGEPGPTAFQT